MLPKPFRTLPHQPTIPLEPFEAHVAQEVLDKMMNLIKATPPFPNTYESRGLPGEDVGLTKTWLDEAIAKWTTEFDWRAWEARTNSFVNYKASIDEGGHEYKVHFVGLFSAKADAQPIIFCHGWPGSFLEFIPLLELLVSRYTPDTLPFHIIVPSLIGFGYSSAPPLDSEYTDKHNALIFHKLMTGLGFTKYIAQGGDIGAFVCRYLALNDACTAIHLNFWHQEPTESDLNVSNYDEADREIIARWKEHSTWEFAYYQMQASKASTVQLVAGSSPVSLLIWIGDKMMAWSDKSTPIPLDTILANVTLYWVTGTFPHSIYHYRSSDGRKALEAGRPNSPGAFNKPFGYSQYPHELLPVVVPWVKNSGHGELVWSKTHSRGGHFAALEVTEEFWQDVEDFVATLSTE